MGTRLIAIPIFIFLIIAAGCSAIQSQQAASINITAPVFTVSATTSPTKTSTATRTPSPSVTATITPTSTITITPEPEGCLKPPDDYDLVTVNGYLFNARTQWMLNRAAELYLGEIDVAEKAITQGSFHDNGAASFGTHLGGGAVDISVMREGTYTVLYDEIDPLIHALRTAGFAAWLRELDELYPGSSIHIHAIAIGDNQLSDAAKLQLTGPTGYFSGYDGLPDFIHPPTKDRNGGPIICTWMLEMGYYNLDNSDD